jgi:sugar lactone lactonase YvrE
MLRLLNSLKAGDELGEAILWNQQDGKFWWTDIHGKRLRRHRPGDSTIEAIPMPERLGSFALIAGDESDTRILAAFETGLAVYDLKTGEIRFLHRPESKISGRRFNDGRVDRAGRFWAGTMVENAQAAGKDSATLWRVETTGVVTAQLGNVAIANGLAANLAGTRVYFADSPKQIIFKLTIDETTGLITEKSAFAKIDQGFPDGATVDAEDCLWVAIWGAGTILRFDPSGRRIASLALPASQPTCLAFGGGRLDLLYVTSAREGLLPEEAIRQDAGNVFVIDTGVHGVPEPRFAGRLFSNG